MLLILFVAGLGLGVAINSLADNLPPDAEDHRYPPRWPRCHTCGQMHRGALVSAMAGLLLRGGRCDHCGTRRPWRPLVVEAVAGVSLGYAWAWAGQSAPAPLDFAARFAAAGAVLLIFLLVVVIDVEHRLILWSVVLPAAIVLGVLGSLTPGHGVLKTLAGGAAGYATALAIYLLAELFVRLLQRLRGQPLNEVAFGGGDVNLAGLIGLAAGWPGVILALMIAVLAGGLYSLGYILVQLARRRYEPYSAVPYGPFLVLGGLAIFFYGKQLAAAWLGN